MSDRQKAAYRTVLRSTSIVGGATLLTLVISLLRTKLLALMLAPAGIGLIGLWTAVMNTGSSVAGLGLHSSGVRQIAATSHAPEQAALSRRAIWTLSVLLSSVGGLMLWLLRRPIAVLVTGDASYANSVGWLAIGMSLGILGTAQLAVIQGYRRMRDYARIQILAGLLASVTSVAAVALLGRDGILIAVLAIPTATLLLSMWYARKLPDEHRSPQRVHQLVPVWKQLAGLGLAISTTAIIGSVVQICMRTIVLRHLGLSEAGLLQAAWTVSAVNLSLLLSAMAADYYPRISSAADQPELLAAHLNQQTHVALVLAAPVLTAATTLAPLLLTVLYSPEFREASSLMRWITVADVLRITGWSVGFVMLARNASFSYVAIEATFGIVFLPLMMVLTPVIGLEAAGVAYFVAYLACLLLALALAARLHFVRVSPRNLAWTAWLTLFLFGLMLACRWSPLIGGIAGLGATIALSLYALIEIERMGVTLPFVGPLARRARVWLQRVKA